MNPNAWPLVFCPRPCLPALGNDESVELLLDIRISGRTLRPTASGHFFNAGCGKPIVHIDTLLRVSAVRYLFHCGKSGMDMALNEVNISASKP
jgi:hypothetical protein